MYGQICNFGQYGPVTGRHPSSMILVKESNISVANSMASTISNASVISDAANLAWDAILSTNATAYMSPACDFAVATSSMRFCLRLLQQDQWETARDEPHS